MVGPVVPDDVEAKIVVTDRKLCSRRPTLSKDRDLFQWIIMKDYEVKINDHLACMVADEDQKAF